MDGDTLYAKCDDRGSRAKESTEWPVYAGIRPFAPFQALGDLTCRGGVLGGQDTTGRTSMSSIEFDCFVDREATSSSKLAAEL